MPSFLSLFRSKQRARSAPPASRHIWPGRHRSQSGVLPLGEGSQPDGTNEEVQPTKTPDDDDAVDARSFHESDEEINALDDGSPLERQVSNAPRGSHKSNEGSDHSRSHDGSQRESQPGSKRLKGFMARFRMTRSQDRSSASELLAQSIPQDAAQDPTTTDPVKKDIPPRDSLTHESEHGLDTQEQNRNVSAQTVQSQDSNQTTATVFRHPSQRIAMPINELQDEAFWSSLLNFNRGPSPTAHTVEPSDPFSDGKDIEPQHHQPAASSHYSGDRSQKQSETSGHTSTHTQAESEGQRFSAHQRSSKSHSSHNTPPPNATRVSSVSSHSSRTSRLSRVDPSRAAMAFEVLATQLKLSITLREDEPSIDRPDESQNAEEDGESGRRRRFRRVRPTQSNFTLGESSPPPASRLRRTKTFANLGRRSSPMSSLRGKSLDTIARLGGHSYLILPPDLAPAPLQLPACIVAMIMYLRRSGL
ncbi:hypothetical protein N7456_003839 [Penicillium angulare]|uniref:Uncharacterized protein n=1 Tax=Penicillium angulare TaxID=116970 RepID=A0A9W9FVH6_9EURO|nr:hypothetical protein N7456_003839 [Penicillium angulare]